MNDCLIYKDTAYLRNTYNKSIFYEQSKGTLTSTFILYNNVGGKLEKIFMEREHCIFGLVHELKESNPEYFI